MALCYSKNSFDLCKVFGDSQESTNNNLGTSGRDALGLPPNVVVFIPEINMSVFHGFLVAQSGVALCEVDNPVMILGRTEESTGQAFSQHSFPALTVCC